MGRAVARFQKVANRGLLTVKTQPLPRTETNTEHQDDEQKIILSTSTSPASAKGTNFEYKEFSDNSPLIGVFHSDINWEEDVEKDVEIDEDVEDVGGSRRCSNRVKVPVPQSLIEFVGLDGLSPGAREKQNSDQLHLIENRLKRPYEKRVCELQSNIKREAVEKEDPMKVSIQNQMDYVGMDRSRIFPIQVLPRKLDNSGDWDDISSKREETAIDSETVLVETEINSETVLEETVINSETDLDSPLVHHPLVETFLGESLSDIEEDSLELGPGVSNESDPEEHYSKPILGFSDESDLKDCAMKPVHRNTNDSDADVNGEPPNVDDIKEPGCKEYALKTKQEDFEESG